MKLFSRSNKRWITGVKIFFAIFTFLVLCATSYYELTFTRSGYLDFYLHKSTYDDIVQKAKRQNVAPGKTGFFTVSEFTKRRIYLGDATGSVFIYRDAHGHDIISIVTADHDHGGVYGYVYSDSPSLDENDLEETTSFEELDWPMNSHWLAASNHLL